jgi:hypothetical protein
MIALEYPYMNLYGHFDCLVLKNDKELQKIIKKWLKDHNYYV